MLFNHIEKIIRHNKEIVSFFFKIAVISLALFLVYCTEYRIYNASIKPVIEHTNFILMPGKAFIRKAEDADYIFVADSDVQIHSKIHADKKDATMCEENQDTTCFVKVKVAALKGKTEFLQKYLIRGKFPDTPDGIAINKSLADKLKLGIGDKAGISKPFYFQEKQITGIIKNSYGFPDYTPYKHKQYFCYFDMPLGNGTVYSFSDNKNNAWVNVFKHVQNTNRKIYICSFISFMVLFISNTIALFCIQEVLTFRQYCNRLLLLGIKRRYIRRKQIMFYMIFMLASMLFSCGLNLHFFIVNAFSAIFAVMINLFLKRYKKYAHS